MADAAVRADVLARRIARATATAWIVGVLVLTGLCVLVADRGYDADLEAELRAHAIAAYGLAWFEADGTFHGEVLAKEEELLTGAVRLSVARPGETVFGDIDVDAQTLVPQAMAEGEVWRERPGERVLALATFDEADRVVGAVIASASTGAARGATVRFALLAGALAVAFAALGWALSRRLAARILEALLESVSERERVLAGAAHELRTPLATLTALTAAPGDPAATLEEVATTTREASVLVDRLLTWSRLAAAAPELEPLRFDLLVESLLADEEPFEGEDVTVHGDPRLLTVAVQNLLENARKHGGGVERVSVSGGVLTVHDRGPGVHDEGLLAPFVKGAASRGTGLGLALVARIVEAHGGRVELGDAVKVVLPVR